VRDPRNKWYVDPSELSDAEIPFKAMYAAGWGYLLSRDLVMEVVSRVNRYEADPEQAPKWLRWVVVGQKATLSFIICVASWTAMLPAQRRQKLE
jgi:hypothetical protein